MTCSDDGQREGDLPEIPLLEKEPDNPVWIAPIDIAPLLPHIYDGCTDIVFPIHTSPKFAADVGLPGIILQGTATLALAVREIVHREADRNPEKIKLVSGRFTGMVRPGTRIAIHLTFRQETSEGKGLFFEVQDENGAMVVSAGYTLVA